MSVPDEFQKLRDELDVKEVVDMGLHVKLKGDGFYIDFEIENMTDTMKRQLFDQLCSLVITYKKLSGFIREDDKF